MILPMPELRAFVTLADQRHFGRAADRLHITQPALTKQIRRLEEAVGGALVLRGYRDVQLTPAGQVLLPRAERLLQESAAALESARRAARGQLGVLRVGFGLATIPLLPDLLLRFRATLPGVELRVRDMPTPAQVAALTGGGLDVGFVRLPVSDPRIETQPILRERLVALLGADSRWRAHEGLRSLSQEPFVTIARATSASFHDHVIAVCRAAGFAPNIVQEANELFTMMMLVQGGMGVALAPSSATLRRPPGVRVRPLEGPDAAWDIGIAWSRAYGNAPLVRAFVETALRGRRPALPRVSRGAR
jgi:DNA-binding transcriptional LysR family regulator